MNHHGANGTRHLVSIHKGLLAHKTLPPVAVWDATRRVVFTQDAPTLAMRLGVTPNVLYRYATDPANPSGEHRELPAKLVGPLTTRTGRTDLIDFIAADCHGVFVPHRDGVSSVSGLLDRVAALTREFADVQACCATALSDLRLTREERVIIQQQVLEMIMAGEGVHRALGRLPLAKASAR